LKLVVPILFLFCFYKAHAQVPKNIKLFSPNDTTRIINIKKADRLREQEIDAFTTLQCVAGNVIVTEGKTTFYCDSAVYNRYTNELEAFGHVHVNDADSVHTYTDYLKYIGNNRIAYLKKNVRITDKKGTLYTNDLDYDLNLGIANFRGGGRVINGKTVLTSKDGTFFNDTRDVYFKNNVLFKDEQNTIKTDSLRYNLRTGIADFITYTEVTSKEGVTIKTNLGTYNLNTGEAVFFDGASYQDSARKITGKNIAYDKRSGVVQVSGNGKVVDTANNAILLGNEIYFDTKKEAFLAYQKPVLILYKDKDTTYVAADTLFSGLRKYDSLERRMRISKDTLTTVVKINATKKDTAIRYFIGFHNVRIFNDSLQAVSDSLHLSSVDSTFKLFGNPLVWNGKSQISGDTLHLLTKNQKPHLLHVYNNAFVINQVASTLFNQVKGRTLHAYFLNGQIDYVRVRGVPAESILYPQNPDSAFIGLNRSKGDVLEAYFANQAITKIKYINDVTGIMYPFKKIPASVKELAGFLWQNNKRPKTKLELFE
jgi:lipopolysaccharide export system protein LptA